MKMDGWQDRLHSSFLGEHVLFGPLRLNSYSSFVFASLLTMSLCLAERAVTYAISTNWCPVSLKGLRFRRAVWRASLYWVVTLGRLLYMLITMTFHVGLILVTVTSLAAGQFVVEYLEAGSKETQNDDQAKEPLLPSSHTPYEDQPVPLQHMANRPRSRSKPEELFIHPTMSNVARADAALKQNYASDIAAPAWKQGTGNMTKGLFDHGRDSDEHESGPAL